MELIMNLLVQTEAKAIVTALIIQIAIAIGSFVFQQRPKLVFTQKSNNHFLVPNQSQPPQPELLQQPQKTDQVTEQTVPDRVVDQPTLHQPDLLSVQMADFLITNQGRLAAKNVEVIFNYPPQHYNRYPYLPVHESVLNDGRFVLTIGMLNPKEQISISLLNVTNQLPDLTLVRCEGYSAKEIPSASMRVLPIWFNIGALATMMFGVFSLLYFVSLYLFNSV